MQSVSFSTQCEGAKERHLGWAPGQTKVDAEQAGLETRVRVFPVQRGAPELEVSRLTELPEVVEVAEEGEPATSVKERLVVRYRYLPPKLVSGSPDRCDGC